MGHQLRDFIYLDTERVRSFLAQAVGGLVSQRAKQDEHVAGGKANAKGKLFVAEMGGELDYHFRRSATETFSLHDALFAEFLDNVRVSEGPSRESAWNADAFRDGELL